jgi:hypothetical protein
MNARDLVNRLLEADEPSAGDKTGVYIFGPKLPVGGYVPSMEQAISEFKRYGIVPKESYSVEQVMNYLVRKGYTFFLKKAPGDIEVIGRVPANTTPEGQARAAQFLGLERQNQVQHRATITSTPKPLDVDYVLFGSKELENARREQEKAAKERQQQQRGVPTKSKKLGKIDPEAEGWQAPPTGVGYSERGDIMPLNAPVQVGFVYNESENGLHVGEVVPGGPAAQAGLQAGDIVYGVHPFTAHDGETIDGPRGKGFDFAEGKHLEYVLRKAHPNQLLSFKVYRGDKSIVVPIQPEARPAPKRTGTEMHIPGEEVRRYFQQQQREPRQKRSGPYQRTFTRRLGVRPNEGTPPSTTGNQPPNVSSLT